MPDWVFRFHMVFCHTRLYHFLDYSMYHDASEMGTQTGNRCRRGVRSVKFMSVSIEE